MKKLCYVATVPAVVHAFLRLHIQAAAKVYEVTVVCNAVDQHLLEGISARFVLLPIERKPSPWRDLVTLYQLWTLFRAERFDIVHSIMPKMGLLAMLAAWAANVHVRLHTFTGQVWVTKTGLSRKVLKSFDKLIAMLATCVLVDSPSQRDFLVREGVLQLGRGLVLVSGSICGVDTSRFRVDANTRQAVRRELGIAQDAILVLFVGRLSREKGMLELAAAFKTLAAQYHNLCLLLVGTQEDVPFLQIQQICFEAAGRLLYLRFTPHPERYMAAADIYCQPSHREGFGMTIIEAAACGVPCVASRIYGISDAVDDGKTGLLFPVKDVSELTSSLLKLITDNELRMTMGDAASMRVTDYFLSEKMTVALIDLYAKLLLPLR